MRLVVETNLNGMNYPSKFQFQCGAIGRMTQLFANYSFSSFNSSVVRLVVSDWGFSHEHKTAFQFQCGAIGSNFKQSSKHGKPSFNSSVVRLVENPYATSAFELPCFNSSVVRLVAISVASAERKVPCFNSSVVRLVAGNGSSTPSGNMFQFQCGAIGRYKYRMILAMKDVSIPVWCDW